MACTLKYKDVYTILLILFGKELILVSWMGIQAKYNAKLSIQSHKLFLPQEIITQ